MNAHEQHLRAKLRVLVVLSAVIAVNTGCGGLVLYTVTQTPKEICSIRPSGEFCDDEEDFPSPTTRNYGVEIIDEKTYVYIAEETWIADGIRDKRTIEKEERSTRNGCTTTDERTLVFDEDFRTFSGTFSERTRVDGPAACGDTPFGGRKVFKLKGERAEQL